MHVWIKYQTKLRKQITFRQKKYDLTINKVNFFDRMILSWTFFFWFHFPIWNKLSIHFQKIAIFDDLHTVKSLKRWVGLKSQKHDEVILEWSLTKNGSKNK